MLRYVGFMLVRFPMLSNFYGLGLHNKSRVALASMIGENQQLVPNEPVEFEEWQVEIQDCRKITDHFRGIYRMYFNLIKENRRMSICNRLDLQTLESQHVLPKNLNDHWLAWNICKNRSEKRISHDRVTGNGSECS